MPASLLTILSLSSKQQLLVLINLLSLKKLLSFVLESTMVKIFSNDCLDLVPYIQSLRKPWLYSIVNNLSICVKEAGTSDIKLSFSSGSKGGNWCTVLKNTEKKKKAIDSRVTTENIKKVSTAGADVSSSFNHVLSRTP